MICLAWRRLRHRCKCGHHYDQHEFKPFAGRPCRNCDCKGYR